MIETWPRVVLCRVVESLNRDGGKVVMEPVVGIESCEEKGPKVRDWLGSSGEMEINDGGGEYLEDGHHANETTEECPGFHSLCLDPGGYPSNVRLNPRLGARPRVQ
jgi:predicted RNA-binding protein